MENTAAIFFVSEDEYRELQKLCPNDFPFTYPGFVARINEGIKHMPQGITVKKIDVRIDEFRAWCTQSKVEPNNISRSSYAIYVAHKNSLN